MKHSTQQWDRERCLDEDQRDPLAEFRDYFYFDDTDRIYLDGNSLGRLPKRTPELLGDMVRSEWGSGLVQSWNDWMDLPRSVGDRLARSFLGASPGEVIISDSTSVNFYKLACAALDARPGRKVIVTDSENFPTDRYILAGIAQQRGLELRTIASDVDGAVEVGQLATVLSEEVALVTFSHVAYRSGAIADMKEITRQAHRWGALTLWDLSHSVGSVPIELDEDDCDLAVGCTYKYLNGGPGSPAFLYVRSSLQEELRQPIWGWFSQDDQFEMGAHYVPKGGIERFQVGTPPIIQLQSLALSLAILENAGIERLRTKGMLITEALISMAEELLLPYGFRLASPAKAEMRGSHVTYAHDDAALINRYLGERSTTITDYRTPDRIRIAPVPLYVKFEELYRGIETISEVVRNRRYASQ